jgi:hypothetical protein
MADCPGCGRVWGCPEPSPSFCMDCQGRSDYEDLRAKAFGERYRKPPTLEICGEVVDHSDPMNVLLKLSNVLKPRLGRRKLARERT